MAMLLSQCLLLIFLIVYGIFFSYSYDAAKLSKTVRKQSKSNVSVSQLGILNYFSCIYQLPYAMYCSVDLWLVLYH